MEDELWRLFLELEVPHEDHSIGLIWHVFVVVVRGTQQLGKLDWCRGMDGMKKCSERGCGELKRIQKEHVILKWLKIAPAWTNRGR